jgi:hypothetical protein
MGLVKSTAASKTDLKVETSSGSNSVGDSFGDGDDFRIQDSPVDTDRLLE